MGRKGRSFCGCRDNSHDRSHSPRRRRARRAGIADRRRQGPGGRPSRRAARFRHRAVRARRAGRPDALRRARDRRAGGRGVGAVFRTQAGHLAGAPHIACAGRNARAAAQGDIGARSRQRRHAVPGRLGDGGARRPWPRRSSRGASDFFGGARRGGQVAFIRARGAGCARQGRARASSKFTSHASTRKRDGARSRRPSKRRSPMSASACRTGEPCSTGWRGPLPS